MMNVRLVAFLVVALACGVSAAETPLCRNGASGDKQCTGQLGGVGPTFSLATFQGFVANGYVGIAGDGSSTINVNVTPWVAPCAGVLKNMRVFSFTSYTGTINLYFYKATAALSPTYSATAQKTTIMNTFQGGDSNQAHAVSLNAGDLIVAFSDANWPANGASITSQFTCN